VGKYMEALKLMERCVPVRTRVLGANHPYTVSSSAILLERQTENLEISSSEGNQEA
jgi:hypothetical protein